MKLTLCHLDTVLLLPLLLELWLRPLLRQCKPYTFGKKQFHTMAQCEVLLVSARAAPLKLRATSMRQIVDEFRQHIHDSTGAAITATVTLVNSLTNDEVLQSGPAERALGGRTATLLAWGGLGSLHYQCSCAMRAHIFQDGGLLRWQQRHMNEGSLSFSQWERELRLAKPDISGEQSHELWTAMVGENLYMDTDIFDRFVLEHLRATHRTFLHRDAAVTSDVLARVEENQTVRVLADNTGVEGEWNSLMVVSCELEFLAENRLDGLLGCSNPFYFMSCTLLPSRCFAQCLKCFHPIPSETLAFFSFFLCRVSEVLRQCPRQTSSFTS